MPTDKERTLDLSAYIVISLIINEMGWEKNKTTPNELGLPFNVDPLRTFWITGISLELDWLCRLKNITFYDVNFELENAEHWFQSWLFINLDNFLYS